VAGLYSLDAAHVPDAWTKIAFDKFHVAQHLGDAVDRVRRTEHKALQAALGESPLTKTRYLWLQHPDRMTDKAWEHFTGLKSANLKTARAWAIKTHAMCLWDYKTRGWAGVAGRNGTAGRFVRVWSRSKKWPG
jgi:transposase